MGSFASAVAEFSLKAKGNADVVVRKVAIELLTRVVLRSPVGNPELWAANAHAVRVNSSIANYNANLRNNRANLDKRGRLKRGLKMRAVQGKETKDKLSLPAGQGYVGGAFRGNWQVSVGYPTSKPLERIDASGNETIAAGRAALESDQGAHDMVPGARASIYLLNHLPYAVRLEYGHSSQAPTGVVRVAVSEFQTIVSKAARGLQT